MSTCRWQIRCELSASLSIVAVARSCNYHARAIRHIRHLRISVLHGAPSSTIQKLQRVQNNAARIVLQAPRRSDVNSLLQTLYWLPVEQRINYKLAVPTFKTQQTSYPQYLTQHVSLCITARNTRSSSVPLLCVPFLSNPSKIAKWQTN